MRGRCEHAIVERRLNDSRRAISVVARRAQQGTVLL
jgi:hypothetical protein